MPRPEPVTRATLPSSRKGVYVAAIVTVARMKEVNLVRGPGTELLAKLGCI